MNKIDIRQLENQLINSSKSTGRKQVNLNKDFDQHFIKLKVKE